MGTVVNTYLIAGGALLVSAVGATVTGLDIKEAGVIVMAVGTIVFVVGVAGHVLKLARSAPRRRRNVPGAGGVRSFGAIVGQSTVTNDDASGTPLL